MTDSDFHIWMSALFGHPDEVRPSVSRAGLEDSIVIALKDEGLSLNAKTALQDSLRLLHELNLISKKKGADRAKAWEVYQRLDLRNGKHRLLGVRDMMACDLICSEIHRFGKRRLVAPIKDRMAYLLGMPNNPSGVTKIWKSGQAGAKRRVQKELLPDYAADLELSIRGITALLKRESK
ncbi:MAG: hypothetical protein L7S70_11050 [Pseudomonadales bacterium]|nr:hypothetical protein [Pseudomonadales bacterium]